MLAEGREGGGNSEIKWLRTTTVQPENISKETEGFQPGANATVLLQYE